MIARDGGAQNTRKKQLAHKPKGRPDTAGNPNVAGRARPAPRPRKVQIKAPSVRSLARTQARSYKSQGQAVEHVANQRNRKAAREIAHFKGDPIKEAQRSQRHALEALSALHDQNPKAYNHHIARAGENPLRKTLRHAGNAAEHGVTATAEYLKHRIDQNSTKLPGQRRNTAGIGDAKEVVDLAANMPASLYLTGAAALEAAQGRPQRGKKLWHDYKKTSAVAAVTAGDFKEAGKRAQERPITTALELSGFKAGVGRTAGAVVRKAPSAKVRAVGSTDRANLRLYPDAKPGLGPEEGRSYSKDLINKTAQKAHERRVLKGSRVRKHGALKGTQRRPGRDPNVDYGARLVPPRPQRLGGAPGAPVRSKLTIRSRLSRRVDTREFQKNQIVGEDTGAADAATVKAVRGNKVKRKHAAAVQLVAEGVARSGSIRHDISIQLGRLAKAREGLSGPRLAANHAQAKHLRELKNLSDKQLAHIQDAAHEYAGAQQAVQAEGAKLDVWDHTAQSKRFFPALQSRGRRPATEAKVVGARTPEELSSMAKAVQRRVRRGKPVGPHAQAAVKQALGRIPTKPMAKSKWEPVPLRSGITKAIADVAVQRHGPNPEILAQHGVHLPVKILPLSKGKRKTVGGGYAGIRRDTATGKQYHLIYHNPDWGKGARNAALWHEVAHAREVEAGRAHAPTTKQSAADYQASGAEARANAYAAKNMDTDLYGASDRRLGEYRPIPGGPKGRGQIVTRAELAGLAKVGNRRVKVAGRRLNEEELGGRAGAPVPQGVRRKGLTPAQRLAARDFAARSQPKLKDAPALKEPGAARALQRRERRGQSTLKGMPEGGPALVTQRPMGRVVAGKPGRVMPGTPGKTRSGVAFEQGAREVGLEAMRRQAKEAARTVSLARNKKLIDEEFGIDASPKGRYARSASAALEHGIQTTHDPKTGELRYGREPLVPVEVSPNQWVNMPESVLARMESHAAVSAPHDPEGLGPVSAASNMWKNVVLTTAHPSQWLASNAADLSMRTAMAGITGFDVVRGARAVKAAERSGLQGRQAAQAVARGGMFHTAEQAGSHSAVRPQLGQGVAHSTVSVVGTPWRAWKQTIYKVEGAMEALPQVGAVGKAMRQETGRRVLNDDGSMTTSLRSLVKLHHQQAEHFGNRLGVDRALEAKVQRNVEDVVGRWGKVSPAMRKSLGLAPFVQWLGAATRWTLITLPAHHPIKTAIMAGMWEMTEDERKRMGLSYFLPRDKQAADYQMGTIPLSVGKDARGNTVTKGPRLGRMFSFGTAAEGVSGNIGSFLLPQIAGPLDAAKGLSFTGEKMVYPQDWPIKAERGLELAPGDRRKVALGLAAESGVPFGSMLRTVLLEKGRPSDPTSSILTPHTRPQFNKKTGEWEQRPADLKTGVTKWVRPFPDPKGQIYPLGVARDIQEAGATQRTLKKWQARPKAAKGYGFGGGSHANPSTTQGFDTKQAAKKKKEKYGF